MRSLLPLLFLVPVLAVAAEAAPPPPLGDRAPDWAAELGHGAVATAERRDGTWRYALAGEPFDAGHAAVPAERVLFEIGSISKVFTGLLLADAVVEGRLGLDDTLAARLPAVRLRDPGTAGLTLRQLATHTSCLPRLPSNMAGATTADPYARYDRKALFAYLADARLDGTPPCTADYSNLGFGILGVVLEEAYGKPWSALVAEKIAGPLGMTDTAQDLSAEQQARFALPWDGAEPAHPWSFQAMAGAGALRSTLADLAKLADALLAGAQGPLGAAWPVLAGDYAPMPMEGGEIGLALVHARVEGEDAYWHDGGTGGYRSLLQVRPASGRASIVLASNARAVPQAWLAAWQRGAAEPVARTEVALPAATLEEYPGVYSIDRSARLTILRRGGGLVARLTGQPFVPIYPSAPDEFFYRAVDAQLSFHRDAAGKVDGVTLHQNGRDVPATREPGAPPHVEFPAAAKLADYAGEYDFGLFMPGGAFTVRVAGEQLLVRLTGQPELPVYCAGGDRFAYDVVEATIDFERDDAGKVVSLVLHQNGRDMRAPKRKLAHPTGG